MLSIHLLLLVRIASEAAGGKGGGGRFDMAQAGGSHIGEKSEIIDAISKYIGLPNFESNYISHRSQKFQDYE